MLCFGMITLHCTGSRVCGMAPLLPHIILIFLMTFRLGVMFINFYMHVNHIVYVGWHLQIHVCFVHVLLSCSCIIFRYDLQVRGQVVFWDDHFALH